MSVDRAEASRGSATALFAQTAPSAQAASEKTASDTAAPAKAPRVKPGSASVGGPNTTWSTVRNASAQMASVAQTTPINFLSIRRQLDKAIAAHKLPSDENSPLQRAAILELADVIRREAERLSGASSIPGGPVASREPDCGDVREVERRILWEYRNLPVEQGCLRNAIHQNQRQRVPRELAKLRELGKLASLGELTPAQQQEADAIVEDACSLVAGPLAFDGADPLPLRFGQFDRLEALLDSVTMDRTFDLQTFDALAARIWEKMHFDFHQTEDKRNSETFNKIVSIFRGRLENSCATASCDEQ